MLKTYQVQLKSNQGVPNHRVGAQLPLSLPRKSDPDPIGGQGDQSGGLIGCHVGETNHLSPGGNRVLVQHYSYLYTQPFM